ncbi:ATP-binding protein [Streptomyces sp. NPDC017254]|uniref:ATP-binding protein n=1 Tax=unclassified Streptomyces TaxID=2593676 RepID=UPI0037B304A4
MSEPVRSRGQIRRLGLRSGGSVVARCRDFCRVALTDWDWPGPQESSGLTAEERELAVEDVLLVVSEAVTNACLHAGGPTELVIRLAPTGPPDTGAAGDLRIEVSDRSSRVPGFRPRGAPGQPGGNGLIVIDRLARAWGAVVTEEGKSVWMELAAPVPEGGPSPAPGAHGRLGDAPGPAPGPSAGGSSGPLDGAPGR